MNFIYLIRRKDHYYELIETILEQDKLYKLLKEFRNSNTLEYVTDPRDNIPKTMMQVFEAWAKDKGYTIVVRKPIVIDFYGEN